MLIFSLLFLEMNPEIFRAQCSKMVAAAVQSVMDTDAMRFVILWDESKLFLHFCEHIEPAARSLGSMVSASPEASGALAATVNDWTALLSSSAKSARSDDQRVALHYLMSLALRTLLDVPVAVQAADCDWKGLLAAMFDFYSFRASAAAGDASSLLATVRLQVDVAYAHAFSRAALLAPKAALEVMRSFEPPKKDDGTLMLAVLRLLNYAPMLLSQESAAPFLSAATSFIEDELRVAKKTKGADMGLPLIAIALLSNDAAGGADGLRQAIKTLGGIASGFDKKYAAVSHHLLTLWSQGGSPDPPMDVQKCDRMLPPNLQAYACLVRSGSIEAADAAVETVRKVLAARKPVPDALVVAMADVVGALAVKRPETFVTLFASLEPAGTRDAVSCEFLRLVFPHVLKLADVTLSAADEVLLFDSVAAFVGHENAAVGARASAVLSELVRFHPNHRRAVMLSVIGSVVLRTDAKENVALLVDLLKHWARLVSPVQRSAADATDLGELIVAMEAAVVSLLCSPLARLRALAFEALGLITDVAQRVGAASGSRFASVLEPLFVGAVSAYRSRMPVSPYELSVAVPETFSFAMYSSTSFPGDAALLGWVTAVLAARAASTKDGGSVLGQASSRLLTLLEGSRAQRDKEAVDASADGTVSGSNLFLWWSTASGVVAATAGSEQVADQLSHLCAKVDGPGRYAALAALSLLPESLVHTVLVALAGKRLRAKKQVSELMFFLAACLDANRRVVRGTRDALVSFARNQETRALVLDALELGYSLMSARTGSPLKKEPSADETLALQADVINFFALIALAGKCYLGPDASGIGNELRQKLFDFAIGFERQLVQDAFLRGALTPVLDKVLLRLHSACGALARGKMFAESDTTRQGPVMTWLSSLVRDSSEVLRAVAVCALKNMLKANRDNCTLVRFSLSMAYSNEVELSRVFFLALARVSCWAVRRDNKPLLEHEEDAAVIALFKLADDSRQVRGWAVQWLEVADYVYARFRDYLLTASDVLSPESRLQLQLQAAETVAMSHGRLISKIFVSAMKRSVKLKPLHRQMQMVHFLPPIIRRMKLDPLKKNDVILNVFMEFTKEMEGKMPTSLPQVWEALFQRKKNLVVTIDYLLRCYAQNSFPITSAKAAESDRAADKDSSGLVKDARALAVLVAPYMMTLRTNRIAGMRYLLSQLSPSVWIEDTPRAVATVSLMSEMSVFCKRELLVDLYAYLSILMHQLLLTVDSPQTAGARFTLQNLLYSPKEAGKQESLGPLFPVPAAQLLPGHSQWELPSSCSHEDAVRLVQRCLLAFSIPNAESSDSLQVCWSAESLRWVCTTPICYRAHHVKRSLLVYGALQNHLLALDVASLLSFAEREWMPVAGAEPVKDRDDVRAFVPPMLQAWRSLINQADNAALVVLMCISHVFLRSPHFDEYLAAVELHTAVLGRLTSLTPGEQKGLLAKVDECAAGLNEEPYFGALLRGLQSRLSEGASVRALTRLADVAASCEWDKPQLFAVLAVGLIPWLASSYAKKSTPRDCTSIAGCLSKLADADGLVAALEGYRDGTHKSAQQFMTATCSALGAALMAASTGRYALGALVDLTRGASSHSLRAREMMCALLPYMAAGSDGGKKSRKAKDSAAKDGGGAWFTTVSDSMVQDSLWTTEQLQHVVDNMKLPGDAFPASTAFVFATALSAAAAAAATTTPSLAVASQSPSSDKLARKSKKGAAAAAAVKAESGDEMNVAVRKLLKTAAKLFDAAPVELGNAPPVTIGDVDEESSEFEETQMDE
jgi:hypothetical protein